MLVGIIGAMKEEVQLLKERMEMRGTSNVMGLEFIEGKLGGRDVVLVVCGIGKVNAAVCAQTLIEHFSVTHLVFTGVAGSLNPAINICDVVVSTDCVQHDFDVTGLGFAPGVIPYMDESFFKADPTMREAALRAVREAAPEVRVWEGRIASGDQFVGDAATKDRIVQTFGALCCEMEGAAVAHVAWMGKVPFVVIRAISDKADGSAEMDYPSFMNEAANRSASIVTRLMKLL